MCWLAASITMVTAACVGSSSSHATLSGPQTMRQLAGLGMTGITPLARASYRCDHAFELGPARRTGRFQRYAPARYAVGFRDDSTHGMMMVIVFPNAATAQACVRGARFAVTHSHSWQTWQQPLPYRAVSPATIETHPVAPGTPEVVPGYMGEFDTALARGPVLAMGEAGNLHDSATVERDLARAASAIAG